MFDEAATGRTLHRFTVDDYYRMAETGILREDPGLELIDGLIVARPRMTPPEASTRMRLLQHFHLLPKQSMLPAVNGPLRIDEFNETEPDLLIVKYRPDFYSNRHPEPRDVLLLIEVADVAFAAELRSRPGYYAKLGIKEVWMVDAVRRAIHTWRDVKNGAYQTAFQTTGADRLAPLAFPDFVATVREIFGDGPQAIIGASTEST